MDLEDGEIHDPTTSKTPDSPSHNPFDSNSNRNKTGVPSSPQSKVHCRYYLQGRCHWASNCKYIHPMNDSTKSTVYHSLIDICIILSFISDSTNLSRDDLSSVHNEVSPPNSAGIPLIQPPTNSWIPSQTAPVVTID